MTADASISGAGGGPPAVQKQVQLPLRKAIEIALRSLRVRMARSVLTLITIITAIAFLTNVWMNSVFEGPLKTAQLVDSGLPPHELVNTTGRTAWLISLSLLVCMVGISNAMLMSVMERFREIGTMKCLGALDSFILKLFLLESTFLGAVGTAAGVALGFLLTLLLLWRNYPGVLWRGAPWNALSYILPLSFVIGILITAVAAMYPAYKAARMEPVAAMRVEV